MSKIVLTKEEKEKEEVKSWEECLSEQKFWILYNRFNNHELPFRDFITEVCRLRRQHDTEQLLLEAFRENKDEETRIKLGINSGLPDRVVQILKEVADMPQQVYTTFQRRPRRKR